MDSSISLTFAPESVMALWLIVIDVEFDFLSNGRIFDWGHQAKTRCFTLFCQYIMRSV